MPTESSGIVAISREASAALAARVKELLTGIDACQVDSEEGWWETSAGASFGEQKLRELLEAIKGMSDAAG